MAYGERLLGALGKGPFAGGMLGSFLEAGDPNAQQAQPGASSGGPPRLPAQPVSPQPVQAGPVQVPSQGPGQASAPFGIRVPDNGPVGPSIFDKSE